jgi:hypothetical protein
MGERANFAAERQGNDDVPVSRVTERGHDEPDQESS